MKCYYCSKENELEEMMGIRYIFCCEEVQTDYTSLRPRVRESVESQDRFWRKLYLEIKKDSN